ncbi:leucine--tRNA ligase [Rarobacter faecitabidus]|uniref:Leucine--tRNA ligase n=1 Tax=Rarobacter faecitabidus TaxID=13243 RepID=A0A542ZUV7_RARFA|nr:leucine--tRNA ligase [Rarobacter faecitabidus]TQL64155.1 leucyl-tRNA synthetase [Rarobacter faecitabidus]
MTTQEHSAPNPASAPGEPALRYTPALAEEIELKWQEYWERNGTFFAADPAPGTLTDGNGNSATEGSSFFVMDMFPYPSGAGLHVGHPLGYIATDVVGRFRRMRGDNVLHALGYDAFGLPAEQYAVQTGQHPRVTTEANIANMRRQLRRLGLGHDSRRSFATTDSDYVRWTQWIFLQIFNAWYDAEAEREDGGRGKARPIAELIAEFDSGKRAVPAGIDGVDASREWAGLDESARRRVIDSFRLAYTSKSPVNWCPGLGTVLANEEVTADGRSERGNFPVFTKELQQWNMRITAYADRLAADLDLIDWPDKVRSMQRHWIGRSDGAYVDFEVPAATDSVQKLTVFTTRPDTLFGATYVVAAPEHPLVDALLAGDDIEWSAEVPESWRGGEPSAHRAVAAYRSAAAAKTPLERQAEAGTKSGVFTGAYAINPVNGDRLPVFIADYVLMGYGTGAIMAVPGGDTRDFDFAQQFGLPVIHTVQPPEGFDGGAYTGDGAVVNSSNGELNLNGKPVADAKAAMIDWLEAKGLGERTVTYRLRDWLFSRQRYWGEPFPIVYDETGAAIALPDSMLPIDLPEVPDYSPRTFEPDDIDSEPEPPLGRNADWVNVTLDLGDGPREYRRDTNTMPNWAGSCWYYLRYLDPNNASQAVSPELEKYWMGPQHNATAGVAGGVDLYVGGVEHAVLHLLYARFWHKVLYDLGHVSSLEPFHELFNQGYIQAYAYTDARGAYVPADEVEETIDANGKSSFTWNGEPVKREYGKMGKSLKNVVTPDQMYRDYGADTFRLYEMSMGPLDLSRPWETRAVVGSQRFLQRLWRNILDESTGELIVSDEPADEATRRALHRTIAEVTVEMENMRPNTAIAKLITLNNHVTGLDVTPREVAEPLVLMIAPFAPHIAEELWSRLGHERSLAHEPYPTYLEQYLVEDTVTCVFQVKGKVRGRAEVPPSISDEDLTALALADPGVVRTLDGAPVRTVIVRAPKLVNVVPG